MNKQQNKLLLQKLSGGLLPVMLIWLPPHAAHFPVVNDYVYDDEFILMMSIGKFFTEKFYMTEEVCNQN